MAISTSVGVQDNMSVAFMNITKAINVCLGTFVDLQSATANGISADRMDEVHNAINDMNASAALFNDELQRINNTSSQLPPNLSEADARQQQLNRNIASGTNHADGMLRKIKGMIGAYASWKAGEKVLEMSDTMANAKARIDLMNDGLQSTEDVMKRIYASAQNARGGFVEMANTVGKLGNNAGDAFSNTNEIIDFANLVQKQFVIAGAGAEEAKNAMIQLTQALGSGMLRGEEFNSINEQAPIIIKNIADYLDVPKRKIKDMASEGMITADIVKNAMFSASDDINKKFNSMPVTFSQAATSIKNSAIVAFQPFLDMLGEITETDAFNTVSDGIINSLQRAADVAQPILQALIDGGAWVVENWEQISPVIAGATAAYASYVAYQGISKALDQEGLIYRGAMAAATFAHGVAMTVAGVATGNMALAQEGLNLAMNACPMLIIATLIGVIVAAIYKWIQAVGGVRIAWMIVVDDMKLRWDFIKVAFSIGVHYVQNKCDLMVFAFTKAKVGMANAMGLAKVAVLGALQEMINGAIAKVNAFINLLNQLPFVSIPAIQCTATFAIDAAAEEAAKQAGRAAEVAQAAVKYQNNKKNRAQEDVEKAKKGVDAHLARQKEIEKAQKEAKEAQKQKDIGSFKMPKYNTTATTPAAATTAKNTGATADNTKKAADALEVTSDNLAWMKDIAEREVIDRTVFRDIKVNLGGVKNTVNKMEDLDGIADYIGESIAAKVRIGAEGVH